MSLTTRRRLLAGFVAMAAAAGLASLEILRRPGAYEQIFATGRTLMTTMAELLRRFGIPGQVIGEPPMFDVVFTTAPIANYRDVLRGDADLARRFNAKLRPRGILKGDSKYYVSLAHTEADVAHTIAAWTEALAELAQDAA